MGQTINKIDEGLFICGVQALNDDKKLEELGIRCILNVAGEDLYRSYSVTSVIKQFEVKIIGADDHMEYNLSKHFDEIVEFIEAGRKKGGVVVHCAAGVSRASTSACAYLMIKEHWSLHAAYARVRGVRRICRPNPGFWRQLQDLEVVLQLQGFELKPLPENYVFLEQPEPVDDHAEDDDKRRSQTQNRLRDLEEGASRHDMFIAKYLTAVVLPIEGVATEQVADQVRESMFGGILWDRVSAQTTMVTVRAALAASLSADMLASVLETLPGVATATVEGGTGKSPEVVQGTEHLVSQRVQGTSVWSPSGYRQPPSLASRAMEAVIDFVAPL